MISSLWLLVVVLLLLVQIDLTKAREKLVDQEERLERRMKANSHKEEELKKREEELEAVSSCPRLVLTPSPLLGILDLWWSAETVAFTLVANAVTSVVDIRMSW